MDDEEKLISIPSDSDLGFRLDMIQIAADSIATELKSLTTALSSAASAGLSTGNLTPPSQASGNELHSQPERPPLAPGWSRPRPGASRSTRTTRAPASRAAVPDASTLRSIERGLQQATGTSVEEARRMMGLKKRTDQWARGRRKKRSSRRRR